METIYKEIHVRKNISKSFSSVCTIKHFFLSDFFHLKIFTDIILKSLSTKKKYNKICIILIQYALKYTCIDFRVGLIALKTCLMFCSHI